MHLGDNIVDAAWINSFVCSSISLQEVVRMVKLRKLVQPVYEIS